jgi:hypothetical protein
MCHSVYLASDHPLPLIPFDPENRAFNVDELSEDHPVDPLLQKPFKVYLGSRTNCSCGLNFQLEDWIENNNPFDFTDEYTPEMMASELKEYALEKKCLEDYFEYLRTALQYSDLEWFCSWDGEWDLPILRRDHLSAAVLNGEPIFQKNYPLENRLYVYYDKASTPTDSFSN